MTRKGKHGNKPSWQQQAASKEEKRVFWGTVSDVARLEEARHGDPAEVTEMVPNTKWTFPNGGAGIVPGVPTIPDGNVSLPPRIGWPEVDPRWDPEWDGRVAMDLLRGDPDRTADARTTPLSSPKPLFDAHDKRRGWEEAVDDQLNGPVSVDARVAPMAKYAVDRLSGKMRKLPEEIRPVQVPEIRQDMRESLLTLLTSEGFSDAATQAGDDGDYGPESMAWMLGEITDAQMWWVSPEMCDLMRATYPTMPDTTMARDLPLAPSGLVVFATPFFGLDAIEEGKTIQFQAMHWGTCRYDITEDKRLDAYTGEAPARYTGEGISIVPWVKFESWVPLGRADWPNGYDTSQPFAPPDFTQNQVDSISEDRRILAAFFVLSQQTNLTTMISEPPARHVTKRLARKKQVASHVRLVDVHHRKNAPAGNHRDIEWTHRWLVNGHWRQQAWGPGRQFRRPTYIAPHVKGPDDKPFIPKETVRVWKTP